jgi:hypothetical protein
VPLDVRRARLPLVALVALAAVLIVVLASAPAGAKKAKTGRAFTTKVTYKETDPGKDQGAKSTGIHGKGTVSAKLGAKASVVAAVVAVATGVPIPQIAKGGSYTIRRDISASNVVTGLVVVKFKAKRLGSLCLKFTATAGKFAPGDTFVPRKGSVSALGGTKAAARWRGAATFTQKSITGTSTERLGAGGKEHASLGKHRGLTAACKRVAKFH